MREKDPRKTESIFASALKMVLADGFTALKMNELARNAGVATGTVYLYFDGKEDLIRQLYDHILGRSTAAYTKGDGPEFSFYERFQIVWYNYLDHALAFPEEAAFIEQFHRSPYHQVQSEGNPEPWLQPLIDLLERGKWEGKVAEFPIQLLVAQVIGAMNALVRQHVSGAWKFDVYARRQAFELAWKSIAA